MSTSDHPRPELDLTTSNTARRYNYWVGGKDHAPADRRSAQVVREVLPNMAAAAREGRLFALRAAGYLAAAHGIRQFLDIGAGQPLTPNVHDVVQAVDPAARVVYVDNDPVVGVHHRGMIFSCPQGRAEFQDGDLLDVETLLAGPAVRETLDLERPVGVLLCAVLHLIGDDAGAYAAVRSLIGGLAPGSFVVLLHGTFDTLAPATVEAVRGLLATGGHGRYRARGRDEVAAFLDGLDIQEPGLVASSLWHPELEPAPLGLTAADAMCYAAVARKP